MTYLRGFCYFNSHFIRKGTTLMFMNSVERWIQAFIGKLSDRCFCRFPAPMLVPIRIGAIMTSPWKALLIWVNNLLKCFAYMKNHTELNLGEGLSILSSFHFSDSGIYHSIFTLDGLTCKSVEWIWSAIIRVVLQSDECASRVRLEITSRISDQNRTTRISITTLLQPFLNFKTQWVPIFH